MVQITTPIIGIVQDVEFDVSVLADAFPTGLSGFRIEYGLTTHLQLVSVSFPSSFALTNHTPPTVTAVDLINTVPPGATDVLLVTFRLKITGPGPTELSLKVIQLDDDVGDPLHADVKVGTIGISGVELLVHAFTHKKAKKGAVQTTRSVSQLAWRPWGRKELGPNYVRIRLIDAGEPEVAIYLRPWLNNVSLTPVSVNAARVVVMLQVNAKMLAEFGADRGITPVMILYLITAHGAQNTTVTPNRQILTLSLPAGEEDDVLSALRDKFESVVAPRRFHLAETDVDDAIRSGGKLATTLAAIGSGIVDREL